jgi:hypothetical protein
MSVDFGGIPSGDDVPPPVGILAQRLQDTGNLVDVVEVPAARPVDSSGFPPAPLLAVDRPEVALGVGPFIPDMNTVLMQELDVRVAA